MHLKVLPKGSRALLEPLATLARSNGFILAGGTGLALQMGHRSSEDFDFFLERDFETTPLIKELGKIGPFRILLQNEHTLTGFLRKVKVSFFRYWDHFLFAPIETNYFSIADPRDIGLMKLIAIANRGARKDFIDLYFILNKFLSLQECFELIEKKIKNVRYDSHHLLKSLNYFEDAEGEPMPKMRVPFRWREAKLFLSREFVRFVDYRQQ